MSLKRTIIAARVDGLGARLSCIAGAMFLAHTTENEFRFLWPPSSDVSPGSKDVCFDPGWSSLWDPQGGHSNGYYVEMASLVCRWGTHMYVLDDIDKYSNCPDAVEQIIYRYQYRPKPGSSYRTDYREIVSRLLNSGRIFNHVVVEKVDKIVETMPVEGAIGVHVRRGDLVTAAGGMSRYIELHSYYEYIDSQPSSDIFLCTEDESVRIAFKKRYGSRLYCLAHGPTARASDEAMRFALTEILLLSKTKSIVGGFSAFADIASLIGNKPYVVLNKAA